MKVNISWHKKNPIPKGMIEDKIQWHVNHARECGCRPIPDSIKQKLSQRKPKLIVGILVRNKNKYLLVKETLEGGKDYWIVPGGKVEFGESLEMAAQREIEEETGIVAKKLRFLTFWEAIFPEYNYHTVIFFYQTTASKTKLSADIEGKVKKAKWFTLTEIKKLKLVESAEWLFDWLKSKKD